MYYNTAFLNILILIGQSQNSIVKYFVYLLLNYRLRLSYYPVCNIFNILICIYFLNSENKLFLSTHSVSWLEVDFCDFCCCYCDVFCPVSSCFQMWTYQFQLLHYYTGTYRIYGPGVCTEPLDALSLSRQSVKGYLCCWHDVLQTSCTFICH